MNQTLVEILTKALARKARSKTMALPSTTAEELGRRRVGGEFISFYDLGQMNTGSEESPVWITNPYTKPADITFTGPNITGVGHFYEADWLAFEDTLFDVALEDWIWTYRKLDYDTAYKYGLDIVSPRVADSSPCAKKGQNYNPISRSGDRREMLAVSGDSFTGSGATPIVDATNWTSKGLKKFISGNRYFSPVLGGMFPGYMSALDGNDGFTPPDTFYAATVSDIDITTVRGDLSGAVEAIAFDVPTDVYLMPDFYITWHLDSTPSPDKHWLNLLFVIPDRELMTTYRMFQDDFFTEPGVGAYRYIFANMRENNAFAIGPIESAEGSAALWDYQLNHPDARYILLGSFLDPATWTHPLATNNLILFSSMGIPIGLISPEAPLYNGIVLPDNPHRMVMVIHQPDAEDPWKYVYATPHKAIQGGFGDRGNFIRITEPGT